MFMADMIINFRTSFVQNGEVIVDAKMIAVNYLRGWFLIDAVSAIPFDFVLSKTGASDVRNPLPLSNTRTTPTAVQEWLAVNLD